MIPAFNEQHRLPATLKQLVAEMPRVGTGRWEIVVSDDGSRDRTVDSVRRLDDPRVRVIGNPSNRGKGAALRAGAFAASYPLVVFLDADLPVPVSTIAAMVALSPEAELVVGSRRLPGASFHPPQPLARRLGGRGFRLVVSALGYRVTSDPQCGVKLLRRDAMAPVLREMTCDGFGFDVELIERVRRVNLRVAELPVAWSHVEGSSLRPVRDAARTLIELAKLRAGLERSAPVRSLTPTID